MITTRLPVSPPRPVPSLFSRKKRASLTGQTDMAVGGTLPTQRTQKQRLEREKKSVMVVRFFVLPRDFPSLSG